MAGSLTTREKIAHLHRRLGFGATPPELDRDEAAGLSATIRRLTECEPQAECHPYEFIWGDKPTDADIGSWRYRAWWCYLMVTTETPLREKLALFWHSNLAVSDNKVEDGPMMLSYLQTLRRLGTERYEDLLLAIAKEPAMMRYLDMERSIRGTPNENFAREIMELFTLGVGHYSEFDVREVARAFTGWGYINTYYELQGEPADKIRNSMRDGRPFAAFIEIPTMRDDRPKSILGQTRDWTGPEVVQMLARRPETARRLGKKLWEFFAYEDPEDEVIERMAGAFRRHRGDMRKVIRSMVEIPQFWSERCVRNLTKSPADFTIGIARAQKITPFFREQRPDNSPPTRRMPQIVYDQVSYMAYRMERMGQNLLYPPDVSGWKGGKRWITPAALTERLQYAGVLYWYKDKPGPGVETVLTYVKSRKPKNGREVANALCDWFDIDLSPTARDTLAAAYPDMKALEDKGWWTGIMYRGMQIMLAAPEAHLI